VNALNFHENSLICAKVTFLLWLRESGFKKIRAQRAFSSDVDFSGDRRALCQCASRSDFTVLIDFAPVLMFVCWYVRKRFVEDFTPANGNHHSLRDKQRLHTYGDQERL
jgi:hypothetical protein